MLYPRGGLAGLDETAEEAAVFDALPDDFVGGFLDHDAVVGGEGDDGVGDGLDGADKLGVDHEAGVVEAGDGDHKKLKVKKSKS